MPTKETLNRKLTSQSSIDAIPAKPVAVFSPGSVQHQHNVNAVFNRQNVNGVVSDEDLRKAFQVAALQHSDTFSGNHQSAHPHHAHTHSHPHLQHPAAAMQVNPAATMPNSYEGFTPTSTFLSPAAVEFNSTPYQQPISAAYFAQPPPLPRPSSYPNNVSEPAVYAIAPSFAPGITYADPTGTLQLQQMQMQMQMQMAMQQAAAHSQMLAHTPTTAQEMGFYSVRPTVSRENSLTQGFQTKDHMQQCGPQIGYINGSPQYFPGMSRPNSVSAIPCLSRPTSLSSIGMMPNISRPTSLNSSPGSESDFPSTSTTPLTLISSQSIDSSCDEHSPHHSDSDTAHAPSAYRSQTRVKAATHSASCPTLAHGMCFHHMAGGLRQGSKKSSSEKCAGHTVLHRFLAQQPGVKAEIQGRIARGLIDSFQLSCTFDGEDVCRNCWNALQFITSPLSKGGLGLPLVVYGVTVYFMDYGDAQKGALRNRGTRRHMTYTSDVNGCKGVPLQGEAAMEFNLTGGKNGGRKRQRGPIQDSNSRSHFHKLLLPCLPLCAGLAGQFAQAVSAKGAAIYFKLRDCTPTNKKKANKRKVLEYELIAGGTNNLCRLCTGTQKKAADEADNDEEELEQKAANEDDKRGMSGKDFMKSIQLPQSVEVMWLPLSIFTAWETARRSDSAFKEAAVKYEEVGEDKDATDPAKNGKARTTLRVRKRVKREQQITEIDDTHPSLASSESSASSSSTSSSSCDSVPVLSRPNSLSAVNPLNAGGVGYIGALAATAAAATTTDYILGPARTSLSLDNSLLLSEGESDVDAEFDVLAFGVDSSEFVNPFSSSALLSVSSSAPSSVDLIDTSTMLKLAGMEEDGRGAAVTMKSVIQDSEGQAATHPRSVADGDEDDEHVLSPVFHEQEQEELEVAAPPVKVATEDASVEKKTVPISGQRSVRLPISFHADDEVFVQLSVDMSGEVGVEDALKRLSLTDGATATKPADTLVCVKIFVFRFVSKYEEELLEEDVADEADLEEDELYESAEQQSALLQKKELAKAITPGLYD